MSEELKLAYVNPVGKNTHGQYEYEFFYTDRIELVWGENWDEPYALYGGDMMPYEGTYTKIKRVVTDIPFACAQQNSCFSMRQCVEGCIALCYEDINGYENYPEPFRIVFQFGEDESSVDEKLSTRTTEKGDE